MQYLERYAEPEARLVPPIPGSFAHVVVIPALGETQSLLDALATVPASPTLVILVINARADAPDWAHTNNAVARTLVASTYGAGDALLHAPSMRLHAASFGALLVIDRATAPNFMPPKQGVGLARKIGCDVALSLIERGTVKGRWIHTTDADVHLPCDYFEQSAQADPQAAALVYAFKHKPRSCPALHEAMHLYDMSLRYYVLGLRHANSPYAFHTVGSTIAINAKSYAAVRGFPLRDAAEDFYLLDKLRKVGTVQSLNGEPLRIDGRVSQRVPFGTGKALWRLTTTDEAETFCVYHPQAFDYLRAWLEILQTAPQTDANLRAACDASGVHDPMLLYAVLTSMGAQKALALGHKQTRTAPARQRFLSTWFDAFRTLKFIHALREKALPSVRWQVGLEQAAFVSDAVAAMALQDVCAGMAGLEHPATRLN